jgi:4-amino-4-deoxy-L-arabinose transferase-like glycosyltransferase
MSRTQITLFLALLLGNTIVLFSNLDWTWLRFPAALALIFVLPGGAWVSALGWLQTDDAIERIVLIVGCSSVISALALLIALLLPGPFTETPTLIALNLATLTGLLYPLIPSPDSKIENPKSKIVWPSRTVLLILLAIIAVAAFTRLTRLSYAEFHEDELENMRLIVRAYKGEEYAPFLDSKGPIHWLLPAALWYLNGWVNEGIARTPFVIASVLLVPLMYTLGRRMNGGRDHIGLLAAGFVAVNGFFVALARHVENRALIVVWGALALWFAYRYYKENRPGFLLFAALTLAIGLIAHPTVLLYLPAFGYLIWQKMRAERSAGRQWPWLLAACLLFIGLLALFYIPYLTDPEIGLVYQYFAGERVGESLLYNLVGNIFVEDTVYSSRYHAPVLVGLLFWLLARHFGQWGWRGWALLAGLSAAIITTVVAPEAWIIGPVNLAFIPYALLGLAFMRLPQTSLDIKTIFLWFSLPLGALVFLAQDASNHIQIAYTGWALLAALALADLWASLSVDSRQQAVEGEKPLQSLLPSPLYHLLRGVIIIYLILALPLILFYQYLSFDAPVTTYWRAKIDAVDNPNSIYAWLYGDIPRPRRAISNPRLAGWKAVGYLWATGALSGDFRSINESFAVPIWYTLQTPRSCYDDPQNYWVRRDWKAWPEEESVLLDRGYTLTRVILVDQEPMLHLYQKNAPAGEPEVLDMEAYRHLFDRLVTPARMAQEEIMSHPASLNFGDKLLMRGYDLPQTIAHPGDLLPVTIYWESLAPMEIRYRGFVHLVGADDSRWGQHDDDPACRLLTTEMRPGQVSSRQFRVRIDPATPPGAYRIVFGLYDPATLQRLPIWDNLTGQSPGDSVVLGHLTIGN